jgi:hypothetical protein
MDIAMIVIIFILLFLAFAKWIFMFIAFCQAWFFSKFTYYLYNELKSHGLKLTFIKEIDESED